MKLYEMNRGRTISGSTPAFVRRMTIRPLPLLRWPVCQDRFERLGLDPERVGTVCRGCRSDLKEGCPNTRAWSLDAETGQVKPVCGAESLVYCKHYDCGCDLCTLFRGGIAVPIESHLSRILHR